MLVYVCDDYAMMVCLCVHESLQVRTCMHCVGVLCASMYVYTCVCTYRTGDCLHVCVCL